MTTAAVPTLEEAASKVLTTVDNPLLSVVYETALAQVDSLVDDGYREIPDSAMKWAYLTQVQQLWIRHQNPSGVIQSTDDAGTYFYSTDPLKMVVAQLSRFKRPFGSVG